MVCTGPGELSEHDRLRFGKLSDFGDESLNATLYLLICCDYPPIN